MQFEPNVRPVRLESSDESSGEDLLNPDFDSEILEILQNSQKANGPELEPWRLSTSIQPKSCDHSFNGIMVDVCCCGPDPITIRGVVVGGEIGDWTIWFKEGSLDDETVIVNEEKFTQVGKGHSEASWARLLILQTPITIHPNKIIGLYVHSSLVRDRGIFYHSVFPSPWARSPYCHDQNISIFPGYAKLGANPFSGNAYMRSNRAFSGTIFYTTEKKKSGPFIPIPYFHHISKKSFLHFFVVGNLKSVL